MGLGLEVTTKGIRTGTGIRRDRGREFQILWAATLKLRAPNDVRTNGAEKISVGESEGMGGMTGMQDERR